MLILAYILAIVVWPIATFLALATFNVVLMSLIIRLQRPFLEISFAARHLFLMSALGRLVEAASIVCLVLSQIVAFWAGKGIFALLGQDVSRWLAIPFGLFCLWYGAGWRSGRIWLSQNIAKTIGISAGWLVGTLWIV